MFQMGVSIWGLLQQGSREVEELNLTIFFHAAL